MAVPQLSTELPALVQADPAIQVPKQKDRLSEVETVHSSERIKSLLAKAAARAVFSAVEVD